MTFGDDQVASVRKLIAQEAARDGDQLAMSGWLQRMCRTAVRDLPAMGVGVSLLSKGSDPVSAAASSEASVLIEELQFAMAEGPCIDAVATRTPVLISDLGAAATTWPGYAPAAHDHGVRAVFAFPLQIGAAQLGALDIYRDHPGSLSAETLSRALTFAEVATQELLEASEQPEAAVDTIEDSADSNHFEVYQAQGMVMVQLGVSAGEALARLRAHAYTHDQRLGDVARDIIERRLHMESDT